MTLAIYNAIDKRQQGTSQFVRDGEISHESYPSNITLDSTDCILEDGWYFLSVATSLAELVEPEISKRMRYIQTNLLDPQPWGYIVPFYYADELAMLLEATIESLDELTDSAYQVRPEATESVLAAVPRYVTSWEANGKRKHTLANVVFPIMRLADFLQRAATYQQDVTIL